jgi:L-alanine-DL-glutamate epimerase-like enolase superfamily enzyme
MPLPHHATDAQAQAEAALSHVRTASRPSDLRITDLRVANVFGAPFYTTFVKIYTNQGLVGLGEVRDSASRTFALMLKSRLVGENPCNVDKLFRRIKQFGGHGRQGGGVSAIEIALWDLAGKAYGVPIYQMLGGRFRESARCYCDTDVGRHATGDDMGRALKARMEQGFGFLKMDLGMWQVIHQDGALSAPGGDVERFRQDWQPMWDYWHDAAPDSTARIKQRAMYDFHNVPHPFTGVNLTECGLDWLDDYMNRVRQHVGPEVPLAVDHLGHLSVENAIRLADRVEKHHPAWLEDMVPWQYTDQYKRLNEATRVPICTGEDIYLKENFRPLLEAGGVGVLHPDVLTCGGILEAKKVADLAAEHGVAYAIHMAEGPVAALAAAHVAVATENFLALEYHAAEVPWYDDLAVGLPGPIVQDGHITPADKPGLGIDDLDDEVLAAHPHPHFKELWAPTPEWDAEWSWDRTWS